MKQVLLVIFLFCFISCKQHFYKVPSGGMEETVKTGSTVAVTITDKFERNDIVVFDYFGPDYSVVTEEPGQFKMSWGKRIYRLIAYSGDSVEIKDGEVFVNDQHVAMPPKARLRYEVYTKGYMEEFNDQNSSGGPIKAGDTFKYTVELSREHADDYERRKPYVISIKRILPILPGEDTSYSRQSVSGKWTSDNYGPFKIPSPGDNIAVDENNFKFYHNIPGIKTGMNTINEKLYFVLGDSRYGAEDSRFIGLISQSKMYGVVK